MHPPKQLLVSACGALVLGLSGMATAQTGTLDQNSPFASEASQCGAQTAGFNGSTNFLVWQCEAQAGLAGQLEGFELEFAGAAGAEIDLRIRIGAGWNTSASVWTGTYTKLTSAWEIAFFDVTSANMNLNVGDRFVIELQGNDTGMNLNGTYNAPPGTPCYSEDLYLNGPGCYADCGWRIGFHTYMLTGPGGPSLSATPIVSGQSATLTVNGGTPSGAIGFAYSLTGGGPSSAPAGPCGVLTVDLSPPITVLATVTADAAGSASVTTNVPAGTSGVSVWLQALDIGSCVLTNQLPIVIG